VLRRLLECLARDRTKHQVAEVTSLGLVQMTRKRVGAGLLEAFSTPCECCNGRGVILTFDPESDSQASHHTHGRGGAGHSGAGHGGNGGRVPAPAAIASPASVAARARPADIPPPAATSEADATAQADATAPDGPAANGRQPAAQAEDTQGHGQAQAAQDNSEAPAAPAEPARSGSGRRRRRKPSGTSAASSTPAAPAASEPEVGGATAVPEAQNGAA
jgi:ribonuclease E